MSGVSNNWPALLAGIAATAVAGGTLVPLRADTPVRDGECVMVDNPGPNDVYLLAGGPGVVATTLCLRVPAASLQPYFVGQATHASLCCAAGLSQAVVVHVGAGQ